MSIKLEVGKKYVFRNLQQSEYVIVKSIHDNRCKFCDKEM